MVFPGIMSAKSAFLSPWAQKGRRNLRSAARLAPAAGARYFNSIFVFVKRLAPAGQNFPPARASYAALQRQKKGLTQAASPFFSQARSRYWLPACSVSGRRACMVYAVCGAARRTRNLKAQCQIKSSR